MKSHWIGYLIAFFLGVFLSGYVKGLTGKAGG